VSTDEGGEVERSYVSSVVEAPIEHVWKYLRDFAGVAKYYDRVKSATVADGKTADTVGCERVALLEDGSTVRERLVALSDSEHCASYSLLTEGLGLTNYIATVRLRPVTDGNWTFIEWSSTYEVADADAEAIHDFVERDVYLAAMRGLQRLCKLT
jgi:carbon monoxide dehydrogenase subunit G